MKVIDLMTTKVATVRPETPLKEVARVLAEHRVSGVPVCEDGRLVGVVSEADLLREGQGDRGRTRALEWFRHPTRAQEAHERGHRAADIMTTDVVTVSPDTSIWEATRTLRRANVKRLPVVDEENRLVGIVSRVDLLSAFMKSDPQIEEQVRGIIDKALATDLRAIEVTVAEGRVSLTGSVDHEAERDVLVNLVRHIPGVLEVEQNLEVSAEPGRGIPFAPIQPPGEAGPQPDL